MKSSSLQYANAMADIALAMEAKHAVIEKMVARLGASKIIRNFLFVLTDHRRTQLIPEAIAAFHQVIRQRQGVAEAEVSSAVELSAGQKNELAATLARLTGKQIETKYALDPALLGGAVVRIGDTIYDGSLRSRLKEMRARLAAE